MTGEFAARRVTGAFALDSCTWTGFVLFGKPGNNPYCHHRALEMQRAGKRERVRRVDGGHSDAGDAAKPTPDAGDTADDDSGSTQPLYGLAPEPDAGGEVPIYGSPALPPITDKG